MNRTAHRKPQRESSKALSDPVVVFNVRYPALLRLVCRIWNKRDDTSFLLVCQEYRALKDKGKEACFRNENKAPSNMRYRFPITDTDMIPVPVTRNNVQTSNRRPSAYNMSRNLFPAHLHENRRKKVSLSASGGRSCKKLRSTDHIRMPFSERRRVFLPLPCSP